VHLIALAIVVTRLLPQNSPILNWRSLVPLIKCGPELAAGVLHRHRSLALCARCHRSEPELALG
jgi:hypothetical protein